MRRWFCLWIGVSLGLLTACSLPTQTETATETPASRMTIVPTTEVRQTPQATHTPRFGASPTPIQRRDFVCDNAPMTYLIRNERGQVTDTDDEETLNLRSGPGTEYRILEQIEQLEVFFVLDGPVCAEDYAWYRVLYDGQEGWIAEGDFEQYYAEPYLPG